MYQSKNQIKYEVKIIFYFFLGGGGGWAKTTFEVYLDTSWINPSLDLSYKKLDTRN